MSSGNIVTDQRRLVQHPYEANAKIMVGNYTRRIYSGANYSKSLFVKVPGFTIKVPRRPRGDKIITKTIRPLVRIRIPPRRVMLRLPKRARLEEHDYTTSVYQRRQCLIMNPETGAAFSSDGELTIQSLDIPWTSNDELKLLEKLRSKVAGSDFNAGVALGESAKALKMISDSATKIAAALFYLKRGNLVEASKVLTGSRLIRKPSDLSALNKSGKSLASNWLELQYGWMPLLKDAEGAAQFLAHHHSVPSQQTYRVSRTIAGKPIVSSPSFATFKNFDCYRRTSIIARIRESDVVTLSGLTDPLSVAWELVPYSFVVDWFIPIGNFLQARALAQSLSGTFVTSTKIYCKASGFNDTAGRKKLIISGDNSETSLSFSRRVSNHLSVPYPSVKPLAKVASWAHALNAVALLRNLKLK